MKIGFISDTHGLHREWAKSVAKDEHINKLNECDIIIHCGDISDVGEEDDIFDFMKWYSETFTNVKHKIFIAGNHDLLFENDPDKIEEMLGVFPELTYLNDSEVVINGVKIWGSPISVQYGTKWVFNKPKSKGTEVEGSTMEHWNLIPRDTDILVTHGPPHGKLDLLYDCIQSTINDCNIGCPDLLDTINNIEPRIVAFGHAHSGYGILKPGITEREIIKTSDMITTLISKRNELEERISSPETSMLDVDQLILSSDQLRSEIRYYMHRLNMYDTPKSDITYINASLLSDDYRPVNIPIYINYK